MFFDESKESLASLVASEQRYSVELIIICSNSHSRFTLERQDPEKLILPGIQ